MDRFLVVSNREISNAQYFASPEDLEEYLTAFGDYNGIHSILFPFWSWKVPDHILAKYKCYGMHTGFMLDGRGLGGSPIDNLQKLGIKIAGLNVFEMNSVIDGGKVRICWPVVIDRPKEEIISAINFMIPVTVAYLKQDISTVPERFKRIKNV